MSPAIPDREHAGGVSDREDALRARVAALEETLGAIRSGEVDALVVATAQGDRVFTLHGADEPYRIMVEQMSEGAASLSSDRIVLYANRRLSEMLAIPLRRLVGSPIDQFIVVEQHAALSGLFESREGAARARRSGEFVMIGDDGSRVEAHVSLVPLPLSAATAWCMIATDVSERRRAEEELRLRAELLDLAHDAVIVRAPDDGRVTFWNREAETIYGYSRAEALDRVIHGLLATVYPESREAVAEALARDGRWDGELRHTRKDGREIVVSSRQALQRGADGQPLSIIELNSDITDRKRAEEVRHRNERALREQTERAESASRAKSEFLARMSHELRTPLNSIIGFSQLLELEGLEQRQREHVGYVLTAGGHLLELINEVLELAKIETGQLAVSPEPVSVADAIREALALVAPLAAEHDISLDCDADGLTPEIHVCADRHRLEQVLLNVLSNAIKYNRRGGHVGVASQLTGDGRVRTTVADAGIGIEREQLTKLFEPFERLGAELTPIQGTGLGLALSKGLLDAMGGTIEVFSTPGSGTTVTIELDGAGRPGSEREPDSERRELTDLRGPEGRRQVILYIEDNVSNFTLVERILERHATVQLLAAMQATIGLELAREHHPDLIVLDLQLPDMPGTEVLKRLKADRPTRDIPVVVLTANASKHQAEHVKQLGAAAYLTKPLDVPKFLDVIAQAQNRVSSSRRPPGY